jgi:hypothetical protein
MPSFIRWCLPHVIGSFGALIEKSKTPQNASGKSAPGVLKIKNGKKEDVSNYSRK